MPTPEEPALFAEHRQLPRRKVYAVGRARHSGAGPETSFEVTTWNISQSGLEFQCPLNAGRKLSTGDELDLEFGAEDSTARLTLRARVRWIEPWQPGRDLPGLQNEDPPDRWLAGVELHGADAERLFRFFGAN